MAPGIVVANKTDLTASRFVDGYVGRWRGLMARSLVKRIVCFTYKFRQKMVRR